jgi:hypothetical protein
VVNAYSELDETGSWQDVDSDTYFDAQGWVKNPGGLTIGDIDEMDVFLGNAGTSERIPYSTDAGATYPRWTYAVEQGGDWVVGATLLITVHYTSALATGEKVVPMTSGLRV